jgi:hypothetical protein
LACVSASTSMSTTRFGPTISSTSRSSLGVHAACRMERTDS